MLQQGPYNPKESEKEILDFWLTNKFYKPEFDPKVDAVVSTEEMKKDGRKSFSLICPPPNAYGRPHIGNISGYAYQDAIGRYARMNGKKVFLQSGKDHAGLEGEGVYVRDVLEKKGINKFDLTRDEFYKMIWEFNMQNKELALKDEKEIGLSADFDRDLFTLDPKVVDTVLTTFVDMFKAGMIYKGVRIVNWDPKARTAIADNQCIRETRIGTIYKIKYPVVESRVWSLSFYDEKTIQAILNGTKSVETRALNPEEKDRYFGDIKNGDVIAVNDKTNGMVYYFEATAVRVYEKVEELLEKEDFSKISSSGNVPANLDELIAEYNKLAPNYGEKLKKNGAVAIELKKWEPKEFATVATTRPETMFGDSAIAVNPKDERYMHLIGKNVLIPFTTTIIPIITSPRVELDFGTGFLKVTPAHALDDYTIMLEWNKENPDKKIDYYNIIDQRLNFVGPVPGKYKGQNYKKVLQILISDLADAGWLIDSEKLEQNILIAERTKAIVEPMMSSQWFIDIEKLKQPVIDMVKNGKVNIHPKNMDAKFFHWMENLRDWPISRSLWWGYRLPVWYAGIISEEIDANGKLETHIKIDGKEEVLDPTNPNHARIQLDNPGIGWIQDENVFDTWFSSGQWPYATLMANDLMDTFYPTDVMETAHDILENWVSRMMMFSYFKFKEVPFKDVYLHGLVLGKDGQKMSKSRGNILPIDTVRDNYGTDAVRLSFFYQNSAGASYVITEDKLKNFRNFVNKIWNASKFVLMNVESLENKEVYPMMNSFNSTEFKHESNKKLFEHIVSIKEKVTKNIDEFEFGHATENLYENFWRFFCDVCLEEAKPHLYENMSNVKGQMSKVSDTHEITEEEKTETQRVLLLGLKTYLKMLHPFVPFITEKIWQDVPKEEGDFRTLMYTRW